MEKNTSSTTATATAIDKSLEIIHPNELFQEILDIFNSRPAPLSQDDLIHNMHRISRIIGNDPIGHLSKTTDDGFAILHLLAERGWTDAFLVVLWLCQCHNLPHCFGLLQETHDGVTPLQMLAYDDESLHHFCAFVQGSCPDWFERGDFSSAVFLEHLLFCNNASPEFLLKMKNWIQRYPHALDPSAETEEEEGRCSLLHRYCEACIPGSLDPNVLELLVEEGMKRPLLSMYHGGLTMVKTSRDNGTPLYLILRHLWIEEKGEIMGGGWECVDACVSIVGAPAVLAGWISCVPTMLCTIGMHHLDSVQVMMDRYQHLLEHLSNDDLLHFYGAWEKVCSLPFHGGVQPEKYFQRLYQLCLLEGKTEFLQYKGENIFYVALRRNLDWCRGFKYMAKDCAKVITQRDNTYGFPAPIFAAAVNAKLDTIYQLFLQDAGIFENVQHTRSSLMDVTEG